MRHSAKNVLLELERGLRDGSVVVREDPRRSPLAELLALQRKKRWIDWITLASLPLIFALVLLAEHMSIQRVLVNWTIGVLTVLVMNPWHLSVLWRLNRELKRLGRAQRQANLPSHDAVLK
jgi:hypothetical protein